MIPDDVNIPSDDAPDEFDFFKDLDIPFEKEEQVVWKELESKLKTPKVVRFAWLPRLAAASVLLILSALTFCYSYQTTVYTSNGQELKHRLPDGSMLYLSAATQISYAPYWWSINRSVQLEGEAFFEVQKGSRFAVQSANGLTEVLGTSFNIQARKDRYQVHCVTGRVRVVAQDTVYLQKNEKAVLFSKGLQKMENVLEAASLSWRQGQFYFEAAPLSFVIAEMCRHYDVEINGSPDLLYSGSFSRDIPLEDALNLICLPFNLTFEKTSTNRFNIVE